MNINRHNYEAFFLMYVDNELSAAEKNDVQVFIEQNPDLRQELQLLQQTILKPAAINFEAKTSLFKKEIGTNEMQESLLLLLDNEIADKEKINGLIATNPIFAGEWSLLQQTKLKPDTTIIFEDKNLLYRKTRERVIDFNWLKIAAAAVLIGFVIWISPSLFNKKDRTVINTTASANINPVTKQVILKPSLEKLVIDKPILKDSSNIKLQQQTLAQHITEKHIDKIAKHPMLQQNNINTIVKNDDKKLSDNNLPKNNVDDNSNKEITSNVPIQKLNDEVVISKNDIPVNTIKPQMKINNSAVTTNIYASTASVKDNGDETINDNHILYIPEEKLKATKIGGLFNKVKRAIKNTTNSGVRIANIEIAIK